VPNLLLVPPTIPVCYRRTVDSNHSTKLEKLKFDVLPKHLGRLHGSQQQRHGTWGLSWDAAFGGLHDADGDGLMSSGWGGSDVNDKHLGCDGDGLSDAFELDRRAGRRGVFADPARHRQRRLDRPARNGIRHLPNVADTDNDGLKDGDEV